jgi:hypothetical protein
LHEVNIGMRATCLRADAYSRNIARAAAPMIAVADQPKTINGRLAV